ncbi:MAG: methionine--tRNA ligase [bacterium]
MPKFYITTPIYYVNDVPHIGHAYTTIAADVAARFHRLAGWEVFFATGTDEHGINIERAARANGVAPQDWADRISQAFRVLWGQLNIEYDGFIRTTDPGHAKVVQRVFSRLYERGDIYKGTYEGWYCPPCESFYPEGELGPNRTCPIHTTRQVEWNAEACYLFRLSKYQDWIQGHIEHHASFVEPSAQRNEVLSFVRSGLRDIAVSRSTFKWGIPLPFDPSQVAYVWVDALLNYITVAGFGDDDAQFRRLWPADVHLVGRDILRFHAVIWPVVLHAAGLEPPGQVYAHGFLTFGGQRFSKTLGIILDPLGVSRELAQASGAEQAVAVDALRYFLLREVPFGADGDFNQPALVGRFNADLANDYGNLLNRTLPLVVRDFGGLLPTPGLSEGTDRALKDLAPEVVQATFEHVRRLNFSQALAEIWRLLAAANKYLDEEAPWTAKRQGRAGRAGTILYNTLEALRIATILLSPVLPTATQRAWDQLGIPEPLNAQRLEDARRWGGLHRGAPVRGGDPIFPRIEPRPKVGISEAADAARTAPATPPAPARPPASAVPRVPAVPATPAPPPSPPATSAPPQAAAVPPAAAARTVAVPRVPPPAPQAPAGPSTPQAPAAQKPGAGAPLEITIDEFKRLDIRVGEVTAAERVAGTDKLVKLTVDIGHETRTLVAGIATHYQAADLIGRRIVVLANLKPRQVRGVESRGMLLAATWGDDVAILSVDPKAPKGATVS